MNKREKLLHGIPLLCNQIQAMIIKKVFSTYRSWLLTLLQLLIALVFVIIAMVIVRTFRVNNDLPALQMDLKSYTEPVTIVSGSGYKDMKKRYVTTVAEGQNKIVNIGTKDYDTYLLERVITIHLTK